MIQKTKALIMILKFFILISLITSTAACGNFSNYPRSQVQPNYYSDTEDLDHIKIPEELMALLLNNTTREEEVYLTEAWGVKNLELTLLPSYFSASGRTCRRILVNDSLEKLSKQGFRSLLACFDEENKLRIYSDLQKH